MILLHDINLPHARPVWHCACGLDERQGSCTYGLCTCLCIECWSSNERYLDDCQGKADMVEVDLGRPAPPCSNPSAPAYSDPGDPPSVTIYPDQCPECGQEWGEAAAEWALTEAEAHLGDEWEPPDPPEYEEED